MRDLNITYIVSATVFALIMYIATEQITLSAILGISVIFGGNRGWIIKSNKDKNGGN